MKVVTEIPDVAGYVREMVREAYKEGLFDARRERELPYMLTQDDLEGIFQVGRSAVEKIVRIESFPKFDHLKARYPRDQVLEWINQNTTVIQKYRK